MKWAFIILAFNLVTSSGSPAETPKPIKTKLIEECIRSDGQTLLVERIVKLSNHKDPYLILYFCGEGECRYQFAVTKTGAQKISQWIHNGEKGWDLIENFLLTAPLAAIPYASTAVTIAKEAKTGLDVENAIDETIEQYQKKNTRGAEASLLAVLNKYYFGSSTNILLTSMSATSCGRKYFASNLRPVSSPERQVYRRILDSGWGNDPLEVIRSACLAKEEGFKSWRTANGTQHIRYSQKHTRSLKEYSELLKEIVMEHNLSYYPKAQVEYCRRSPNRQSFFMNDARRPGAVRRVTCAEIQAHIEKYRNQDQRLGFIYDEAQMKRWKSHPAESAKMVSPACLFVAQE